MVGFATHLAALAGSISGTVSAQEDICQRHAVDWSGERSCAPAAVCYPRSSADVSAILAYCNEQRISVVVQGGLTGLSGGATPQAGEVAVSLEKMAAVIEVDKQSMTLTALAGTTLETIQNAAREAGLQFPLDLGARGSCTIGGNVATNAGGNQVVHYGMTRQLVLGLEAVLADGSIINSRNKMLKNNSGYDLKQLFIGSEGTLGVVTEVVVRLFPVAVTRHTALCAFASANEAIDFLRDAQRALPRVTAYELMWQNYVQTVFSLCPDLRQPFDQDYPFYVLLESEGNNANADRELFEQTIFEYLEKGQIVDALIAQSEADAAEFWAIRDSVSVLLSTVKQRANFDIGVPISRMQSFMERAEKELKQAYPDISLCIFGHIADSNLHVIAWTQQPDDVGAIYQHVYEIISEYEGTITAEHGVGVMKVNHLSLCRSEQELALMRAVKCALDPNGILNRGRIVEAGAIA